MAAFCARYLRLGGRRQRDLGFDVAEDRGLQGVVIALADRIELVIVAARAADGQPQRPLPNRVDHIVEILEPAIGIVLFGVEHARAGAEKAGGDQAVVGPAVHLVTGDLFGQERVIGLVGVERSNHVVAVPPGVGAVHVVLEAGGVGVARHVEPVAAVAFAVVRRGEQAVDEALPGIGLVVGEKARDLGWGRRQAEQVQIGAAHQRRPIGARRRRQPALGPCGFEKPIDWTAEAAAAHVRRRRLDGRLERPVLALGRRQWSGLGAWLGRGRRRGQRGRGAPHGALVYPTLDRGDLLSGQRAAAHWHRRLLVSRDPAVQPALVAAARNERRAQPAARQRAIARAQVKLRLRCRTAMAGQAPGFENRPDITVERDRRRRLREPARVHPDHRDGRDRHGEPDRDQDSSSGHANGP